MTIASGADLRVAGHGMAVRLPQRWEGRIYRREAPGEMCHPVLHLANFPLPPHRGDFGTGAVEIMRPHHAFVSLFQYHEEEAGRPLFAAVGIPRLALADFAPNALQRRIPGQLGCQRFFTENGRPFCLYAVLGSRRHAPELLKDIDYLTAHLEVGL